MRIDLFSLLAHILKPFPVYLNMRYKLISNKQTNYFLEKKIFFGKNLLQIFK